MFDTNTFGYDSLLGLYSTQDFLNTKIVEKFKDKYVDVKIFKDFVKTDYSKFSYLIISLLDENYKKEDVLSIVSTVNCKIIIIAPSKVEKDNFLDFNSFLEILIKSNKNLGIILSPEILGDSVKFQNKYLSHDLIMQSILTNRIKLDNPDKNLNLISVNKLVDEIVRETFSFGISGKKILPLGYNKSAKSFVEKYLNITEENIIYKPTKDDFQEITPDVKKEIIFSLNLAVSKSRASFLKQQIIKPEEKILNPEVILNSKTKSKKFILKLVTLFKSLILIIAFVVFIPSVLLLISTGSLFLSSWFLTNNSKVSNSLINLSSSTSVMAVNSSLGITLYSDIGNVVYKLSSVARQISMLIDLTKKLSTNVLGDKIYPFESYVNEISANLDRIYTDISFIQSDIDEMSGILGNELRFYLDSHKISITEIKKDIYNLKKFTSRLSEVMGINSTKKYLILFQNNMELRPTGGFIGSFALITFDKGRITEIVVNDVYSADGQLKGHVEPPEPIKKYLNEASWYLRDSNWDPDFKSTSEKIEWFLDKEIDQSVDGVIAVDLYLVKSLLNITGPINLSDFGKIITAENLYETTQNEVENNFFPGSIKKASFLTSLSRSLIDALRNLDNNKYALLFNEIYKNLESRHIQIYLHDLNSQEALAEMGYTGEVKINLDCGLRCVDDKYRLVDANLGVNKSNLFINRTQDLILNVNKESIAHELFITYDNNSSPSKGLAGIYKNYARILLPREAKVSGLRIYKTDGTYQDLEYDLIDTQGRRELGFYFELNPATSIRIQAVWNIKTSILRDGGEYRLTVEKQPGTEADKLNLKVDSNTLSLTGKANSVYNTSLVRDYRAKLFFRPL